MIEFHKASLADAAWVRQRFAEGARIGCEFSFGNMLCYLSVMDIYVADIAGCFVSRCVLPDFDEYSFPVGAGDKAKAVEELCAYVKEIGRPANFYGLIETDKELLETTFPDRFCIERHRESFDYIYLRSDLQTLSGKKYQSKRNHISFFKRNNLWTYERITDANKAECLAMSREWVNANVHDDAAALNRELKLITEGFRLFDDIGFVGGLIRCDGRVVAYCMGEALSDDVFCVHYEKAFADIRGAYAMINQQFVEHELQRFTYVNREDDVGEENLRQAKLSYHPAFFLEKYEVRLFP